MVPPLTGSEHFVVPVFIRQAHCVTSDDSETQLSAHLPKDTHSQSDRSQGSDWP